MTRWNHVICALTLAVGLCAPAGAQSERRYAVLSLLGDRLTVVGEEPQTGTNIKKNAEEAMELASDAYDQMAARAAISAITKLNVDASAVALRPGLTSKYYLEQQEFLSGDKVNLPSDVIGSLKGAKVTHLVLLTKRRAPASIQLADSSTGHGALRGLGFYVSRWKRVGIVGTSETAIGYLAAYAYFEASLIEMETLATMKSIPVTQSRAVAHTSRTVGKDPWDVLDDNGRLELLASVLTRSVETSVRSLVAK